MALNKTEIKMSERIRYCCLSTIIRKCIEEKLIKNFVILLKDCEVISRAQRKSIVDLIDGEKFDEALYKCFEIALSSENQKKGLEEACNDGDFPGNEKVKEVILKMIEKPTISESLEWIIISWDILLDSSEMKQIAQTLSQGFSVDNWPLEFIYQILMTENTYTEDRFVQDAQHSIANQKNSDNTAQEEQKDMEVDEENEIDRSAKAHAQEPMSFNPSGFQFIDDESVSNDIKLNDQVPAPIKQSGYQCNDSESNLNTFRKNDKLDQHQYEPPAQSATSEQVTPMQIDRTMEEILQEVSSFETSSLPSRSGDFEWEMISLKNGKKGDQGDIRREIASGSYSSNNSSQNRLPHTELTEHSRSEDMLVSKHFIQTGTVEKSDINILQDDKVAHQSLSVGSNSQMPNVRKEWTSLPETTISNNASMNLSSKQNLGSNTKSLQKDENTAPKQEVQEQKVDSAVGNETVQSSLDATLQKSDIGILQDDREAHRSLSVSSKSQMFDVQKAWTSLSETTISNNVTINSSSKQNLGTNTVSHQKGEMIAPSQVETERGKMTATTQVKTERSNSNTSSDGSTTSECEESLNWLSSSIEEITPYIHNIQLLMILTWPSQPKLIEKNDWSLDLIQWLEEAKEKNKDLVEIFVKCIQQVVIFAKPLEKLRDDKAMKENKEKQGISWIRKNIPFLKKSEFTESLFKLAWPGKLHGNEDVQQILKLLLKTNDRKTLENFANAARMMMNSLEQKTENLSTDQSPIEGITPGPDNKGSRTKQLKGFLGIGKPKEPSQKDGDKQSVVQNKNQIKDSANSSFSGTTSGKSVVNPKCRKIEKESTDSEFKIKDDKKTEQKSTTYEPTVSKILQSNKNETDENFHDAVANLEDLLILTKPKEDDSLEIRAAYDGEGQIYLTENYWYNWQLLPMQYDSKKKYFSIFLPKPEHKIVFTYKYAIQIHEHKYWEILPSSYSDIVNRSISLDKGIKYIFDVPIFGSQRTRDSLAEDMSRKIHYFLPNLDSMSLKHNGDKLEYISIQNQVYAWVNQMKRGWKTTIFYHRISLSTKLFERGAMQWLATCRAAVKDELDVIKLILAGLSLIVSFSSSKHCIEDERFFSILCESMSTYRLDERKQKLLFQLINQEFSTKNHRSCAVVCNALLDIFRRIKFLLYSRSPYMDWLLVLPLYWITANNGEIMKKYPPLKKNGGLLFQKSALPEAENFSWSDVRSKCKADSCQRELLKSSEKILKIFQTHTCIVGSYQYFLTERSLCTILTNCSEYRIAMHLHLDSVFYQFLGGLKSTIFMTQSVKDVTSVAKYFDDKYNILLKREKNSWTIDERVAIKETSGNLMRLFVKAFPDVYDNMSLTERNKTISFFVKITNYTAELIYQLMSEEENFDNTRENLTWILNFICNNIEKNHSIDEEDVQLWSVMLKARWPDEIFQLLWITELIEEIKKLLKKIWRFKKEEFLNFYIKILGMKNMDKNLQECFEECAIRYTEDLLADFEKKSWYFGEYMNRPQFAQLFGRLFMKEVDSVHLPDSTRGIMKALHLLSTWAFGPKFFQIFYEEDAAKHMKENIVKKMRTIVTDFQYAVAAFGAGKMKISELDFFVTHHKAFIEFDKMLRLKQDGSSVDQNLQACVKLREKQLQGIASSRLHLSAFISLCSRLEKDHIKVANLNELENISLLRDNMLDQILDRKHEPQKPEKGLEKFWNFTTEQTNQIRFLYLMKFNTTFTEVWNNVILEKFQNDNDDTTSHEIGWEEILTDVWPTTEERLISVFADIYDGSIAVSVLIAMFQFTKGNDQLILTELTELSLLHDIADDSELTGTLTKRSAEIKIIFQMKNMQKISSMLLKLKSILDIRGDFQSVDEIQKMKNNEDISLKEVTLEFGDSFTDEMWKDQKFLKLLNAFVNQEKMIKWLKSKMKDLSEVKVFCDLGMISAGETSYEVDRVSFLLSAVMGFGPLIFDLNQNSNLNYVVDRCKAVRKNFQSDPNLIKKWTDTGRQLGWFDKIQKFHGSVGTQSLTLAQEINKRGIYRITKPQDGPPTIENSLHLSIQPDKRNEKSEVKSMNYDELRDLQSRLMLIAGEADQGQQDVARFNEILAAVGNLTQGFVNLLNGGCMLFNDWSARIACSKKDFVVTVNFSREISSLSTTTRLKDVQLLVDVLNDSLDKWTKYIDKIRSRYYYLNDYNIQQITYLCEKLAKFDFTDQVYSLLSNLPRNVMSDCMQKALEEATRICDDNEVDVLDNENTVQDEQADVLVFKRRMVRELVMKDDLSENLAKAAVQCEENKDIEDCENWALLHQHDQELIQELCELFDKDEGFGDESNQVQDYTSLLHNRTSSSLKELIEQIQKQESMSSDIQIPSIVKTISESYIEKTSKLTLKDYLSIDHLGKFLEILNEELCHSVKPLERVLVPPMHQGKANLLLCPEPDILYLVLSLYMHNESQPLPTRSEVLVCSENTSKDEVERFLRRSMTIVPNEGKKLFCMAFADKLTFNVSTHVEYVYNTLSTKAYVDANYQLVILSSSSKQQHYLVTCFDKLKVELKLAIDKDKLQEYLSGKLQNNEDDKNKVSVRIVTSQRSGVGKSLHIRRLTEEFSQNHPDSLSTTVRLLQRNINIDHVLSRLYKIETTRNETCHFIHFDLTPAVEKSIEEFFFNLIILGSIQDSQGRIWRHHLHHCYAIELISSDKQSPSTSILQLLSKTTCISPKEVLKIYESGNSQIDSTVLMDQKEFESESFQRPYQYLMRYDSHKDLDKYRYQNPSGSKKECIAVLLRHCGMENPTWAQLCYFSNFLNMQLTNCEESVFCKIIQSESKETQSIEFAGLKAFSVYFMIKMAQDFATPSLDISDESERDADDAFSHYKIRRKWEDEIHPFVFFNEDKTTLTFINVKVNDNGDLLDADGNICHRQILSKRLLADLKQQGVPFSVDFNTLSREEKITTLCQFMNIPKFYDPDPTYELTTDNVLKMLAIYMRLRCDIPVIVMGETGCGKTRMIEFMSKMRCALNKNAKNMVTLKIHGGIDVADIYNSVLKAREIASTNKNNYNMGTILFYDEANTTSAIFAIKEVVCDFTIDGDDFKDSQLQIIAACNPYKRLSEKAIKQLEESGLGYNTKASEAEQFGKIPMRRLVYRVVPLPPSMQPFVWDFGQLGRDAEEIYIEQMTQRQTKDMSLTTDETTLINAVLFRAQCYMRKKCKDESRYVSLRDVERSLKTFRWFHKHAEHIFPLVIKYHEEQPRKLSLQDISNVLRSLLHTISVCYHASLNDRKSFREEISRVLQRYSTPLTESDINLEIIACQMIFANNLKMDDNIACNEALRENVFLISVCADLRMPLFIVGKPGSSKSLAKTIVADNMQGKSSYTELYKNFKQVHVLSYQCSALTDAKGIESIFNQCAQLQANQDIDSYTAVVVLDEIGLAEDSPNMPLKVLHPLLECGSTMNGTLTEFDEKKKVGFVGISNWALDPAKMNRGIFVTRSNPNKGDLKKTAEGIFENQINRINIHSREIGLLTDAYMKIYDEQTREYFGLRDYYSLIKMLHAKCKSNHEIKEKDIKRAIQRNFSGGEHEKLSIFQQKLGYESPIKELSVQTMVGENLEDDKSRFLLLLTNQYASFSLLQDIIPNFQQKVQVIFGSSFPSDRNYTEMCRNINRVKVCMEAGRTVILLNMTEINESLYDALNQHYVTLGGQRYVDLGLGGHRVKCRIADGFRLIVIEIKEKVYNDYPIPLLNRLEKHHLTSNSLLTVKQRVIAEKLSEWIKKFSEIIGLPFTNSDAFVGHHDDSASSIIISYKSGVSEAKVVLLQSATMDAVFRLEKSDLRSEHAELQKTYIKDQVHDNLWKLLQSKLNETERPLVFMTVTSFSNILSDSDRQELAALLNLSQHNIMLLSLQQFQTEQDYIKRLEEFFKFCNKEPSDNQNLPKQNVAILLVQCPQAHKHGQLISCARYGLLNKIDEIKGTTKKVVIAFLLSTERRLATNDTSCEVQNLVLQHTSSSEIIYVDELRPTFKSLNLTSQFYEKTICDVLEMGKNSISPTKEEDDLGIHMPTLLLDCVCEAMTKIKSREKNENRHLERIKVFSQLCSHDDLGYAFLDILMTKMIEIYRGRQDEMDTGRNWIVNEACSAEKLQEGGTFAKTLWLCMKKHVSNMLAYIMSKIDRNNNLDLIASKKKQDVDMRDMWLEMFQSYRLQWEEMRGLNEFKITDQNVLQTDGVTIPFSFLIQEAMNEQWSALESEHRKDEKRKIFFKHFCSSNKGIDEAISNAMRLPKSMNLINTYAKNLIFEAYGTDADCTQKLSKILVNAALILQKQLRTDEELPGCHMFLILFYCSKIFKDHLRVVYNIFLICPHVLEQVDHWISNLKEMNTLEKFNLHQTALCYALDFAKAKALEIKSSETCTTWMNLTRKLSRIFRFTLDLIHDTNERLNLRKAWEPLAMLDLLLLHLLPDPSSNSKDFKNYVEIIATHARLLYKGTSKSGIKNQQFLRILCNVLRKYYEDVKIKVIVSWQNGNCRICGKMCKSPTVLPCKHFFCCDCLKNVFVGSTRQCQICSLVLPNDFMPTPSSTTSEQEKEILAFRSNCTSFFLEYLSQFVFQNSDELDKNDDMREISNLIFDELVLKSSSKKPELEKIAFDLNIATCSNILSNLLKRDANLIESLIDRYLREEQNENSEHLILLSIITYEQYIARQYFQTDHGKIYEKCWALLTKFLEMQSKVGVELSSKVLHCIAGARFAIAQFVQNLKEDEGTTKDEVARAVMYSIKKQSDDLGTLQDFFIKIGCHKYGMKWFTEIIDDDYYKRLIPLKLKNVKEVNVDYWHSLSKDYSAIKSELNKSTSSSHQKQLQDWFPPNKRQSLPTEFSKTLAVATWLNSHSSCISTFKAYFEKSNTENLKTFELLCSLNSNVLGQMHHITGISNQEKSAIHQVVVLATAVVKSQTLMTNELRLLMDDPSKVTKMYWPAMPESFYFSIPLELRKERGNDAMYKCPNGHFYTIGQCTKPYSVSRCPDCNAIIGGKDHVAQAGNERVKLEESSQAGYLLNSTEKNLMKPEDRISMQTSSFIQLIIHACMFVGLQKSANIITQLIPKLERKDVKQYLILQMQKNLNDFTTSLGRNNDEATLVIFQILFSILKTDPQKIHQNASWNSIENRKNWESHFRQVYLLPVFQNLDNIINEAQENLNDAEDMTSILLFRHVHEVSEENETLVQHRNNLKSSCLWHMIQHSNASHLMQCIRDNSDDSSGKVLQVILGTPDIHLLLYLEDVLKLQKSLIERYQNQIDLSQAEENTLQSSVADNSLLADVVDKYIEVWALLRHTLQNSGECDSQMFAWLSKDITLNSPISVALPSIRGKGRCAKLVAEHLIRIQNQFLNKCFEIEGINASSNELEVSQLQHSHFVCIDKQNDLLPLIQLHTSYIITEDAYGRHHKLSYNINALEKQARENYVKYKKLIKLDSLPFICYVQDIGIGSDWDKVITHTKLQEPLSRKLMQNVDDLIANSTPADVCEGVRTLTHAISFLAKVECPPSRWLCEYLEKDLLLSRTRAAVIPRFAKVHHTLALYQYLSWHKSVNFVKQGLRPYKEALYEVKQENISDKEVLGKLKAAFQHMDVILFQQHINEMLIKVPDYREDWSLVDDIFPYLQFIGNESEEEWFERIPDAICFKHVSHLFELAVKHVQNIN
ncbi:E3 ubiquitin-protein ligase rnf213-alpha-like isoform X1 [Styela clava]